MQYFKQKVQEIKGTPRKWVFIFVVGLLLFTLVITLFLTARGAARQPEVANSPVSKGTSTPLGQKVTPTPLAPTPTPLEQEATPTPLVPTPTPTPPPPSGLHVQGNLLVNGQGQQIVLHGVNRAGAEYSCVKNNQFMDGPYDEASVQAMAAWHMNVVRLPINEHCWLGTAGVPAAYGGKNYQQFVTDYVDLFNRYGIYVILDMHQSGVGDGTTNAQLANRANSITFWQSVSTVFKENSGVLFDLVNEPHDVSWECWQDQAACDGTFTGMQQLITAIRETGAPQVILLGGLAYANDLTGWLTHMPSDPLHNLVASWHVYPDLNYCNSTSCYDSQIAPVLAQVPVIAGEVGESVYGNVCGVDKSNTVFDWLDAHKTGYLAWTWNTWGSSCEDLSLITDYSGTPKAPNGVNFKNRLAAFNKNPSSIR
jgi:endoglucanase